MRRQLPQVPTVATGNPTANLVGRFALRRTPMRVLIATDAWHPQVNGVVRTLTSLAEAAKGLGVSIEFLTPDGLLIDPLRRSSSALPSFRRRLGTA